MKGKQRGFSLLEVLVAFAILAASLGILYQAFGNSLNHLGTTAHRQAALILTRSLMTEQLADGALEERTVTGREGPFSWRFRVRPVEVEPRQRQLHPFRVDMLFRWREGRHDRQMVLTTLRLDRR